MTQHFHPSPKAAKPIRDKAHLARVASLPCVICNTHGFTQVSRTEVHHCKSGRYSQTKECDTRTIPLCHGHHHKLRPVAGEKHFIGFHNAQATWERLYGSDHGWLPVVQRMIDELDDEILGDWF